MNIILLNEDNLSADHPVFAEANKDGCCQAIFIFDDTYLKNQQYSFKRIVFIYECLKDIDCEIYKGEALEVINEINPDKIFIPHTINPYFIDLHNKISKNSKTEIVKQTKFVELNKKPDLKRFFRYWNKTKKQIS